MEKSINKTLSKELYKTQFKWLCTQKAVCIWHPTEQDYVNSWRLILDQHFLPRHLLHRCPDVTILSVVLLALMEIMFRDITIQWFRKRSVIFAGVRVDICEGLASQPSPVSYSHESPVHLSNTQLRKCQNLHGLQAPERTDSEPAGFKARRAQPEEDGSKRNTN